MPASASTRLCLGVTYTRWRRTALLIAIVARAQAMPVSAQSDAAAPPSGEPSEVRDTSACVESVPGAPAADLYCITLSPAHAESPASGAAHLRPALSPFGTSVSADGVHRWNVLLSVRDLPDPGSLGAYRAYVAWATTPLLAPEQRLGEVGNGETEVGPVGLNQFVILISAESSAEVTKRAGPLVLRGASASMRLQPHDFGRVVAEITPSQREDEGRGWSAPPMHPAVVMPPALMRLRPDVSPFLPAPESGSATGTAPSRQSERDQSHHVMNQQNPESLMPEGAAAPARPAELLDLADGDTLALVAGPVRRTLEGRTYVMYGFNGSYPGPLVRVPRGAEIVVMFENRTEWPTAVHWHGVRVANAFDGVPHVTQEPVPPGGRFTYRVRFPDAGIYWYHPHHREDVQQDLGLYGNLWVRAAGSEPPPVNLEQVLMLDDLLVTESGLFPWGRERATHALMGRFGNLALVNGEPRYDLDVPPGSVVRFYLTNASNARTWNVSFGDAPMKVVATDLGTFERQERVASVVLAPAERYAVDVLFPAAGAYPLVNRVQAIDPFRGVFFAEVDTLGTVRVSTRRRDGLDGSPGSSSGYTTDRTLSSGRDVRSSRQDWRRDFERLRADSATIREIDRYRPFMTRPADHELVLTLDAGELPFPIEPLLALESVYAPPVEWTGTMPEMNAATTAGAVRWVLRDPATGRENEDIRWKFREGDVVKIRLTNAREALHSMHHPIHVHGQRFLVVSQGGVPRENLAWKDTMLLPAGDSAEILLEVTNPGRWMLHCHTAEHLEAGMRMVFEVEPLHARTEPRNGGDR